jgi:hypothetical protein
MAFLRGWSLDGPRSMRLKSPLHEKLKLTVEERSELERRSRAFGAPYRMVVRAKVVLGLAAGDSLGEVGRDLHMQRRHVRKWGERFVRKRLAGLDDEPRSGRPPLFSPRGGRASGEVGLRAA